MVRRAHLVAGAAALALAGVVGAGLADEPGRILHEDFRPATTGGSGVVGAAVAGRNPTAIAAGTKLLPEPTAPATPGGDEPVFGRPGVATDRSTEHRPNDVTDMDGRLSYTEVFNPAVVPFKRMTALDAVRDDYTLFTADAALVEVPVGGEPRPGFDRFWASLDVALAPGVDVAIPSVAADMRVLSYETTPRTALTFSRDGADNYYLKSDEADARGVYRVVFLAEADPRYFVPVVPTRTRVDQLDRGRVRRLPAAVQASAGRALRKLGLTPRDTVRRALDRLVAYHRDFEPGTSPPRSGDLFWDLFDSQRGVCRHRAFTFAVAANALGIPARFVANEAHAWVEVHLPGGWSRIDLGGAALELEVKNADRRTMYQPAGHDPFPSPRAYRENYTQMNGSIAGLSEDQRAEATTPRPGGQGAGGAADHGGGPGAGSEPGGEPGAVPGAVDESSAAARRGEGLPVADPIAIAHKQPTRTRVSGATSAGFRGETVEVSGRVDDGHGRGLGGMRVDVYLARRQDEGEDARLVGHAITDPRGGFTAIVTLPRDLELTAYEAFAATAGDETWQPSTSR